MSATVALLVRSFAVGSRIVTLSVPQPAPGGALSLAVEWAPSMPKVLNVNELGQYRAGRDAALAEVGRLLGGTVAVLEL